jgi:AAA+ superfamily predicted ATPase
MMNVDGTYRWDTAPSALHFTMTEFKTSKNLNNVFGDHMRELKDRVRLFTEHPEWYEERGIPYTLGIMGYGDPGCGKTSIAKALAKSLDVHIFNISLRQTTTQRQLMNLFYDEHIMTIDGDGHRHMFTIPLNKRFYIIEDIDCLTDIVLDREYRKAVEPSAAGDSSDAVKMKLSLAASANNQITLSFLLNLLDGVLETPGRILMITTNYPEKLDRALIRPGRIDVKVHFTRCSGLMISEIMANFYRLDQREVYERIEGEKLAGLWTPAEIIAIFSQYYSNVDAAYIALADHPLINPALTDNPLINPALTNGETVESCFRVTDES